MSFKIEEIIVLAWTASQFMIVAVGNIYTMASLSHPGDTKFG